MKLLTIAIPTYNRSCYLELCLAQLCKQLRDNEQDVAILVSDNASSDNTQQIVDTFISSGFPINYSRNDTNIGADANIARAFRLAMSKYVIVLADDDVLLDGALERIVRILKTGEYGLVHLNTFPYQTDFRTELPKRNMPHIYRYDSTKKFIKRVNYRLTFISGNIINKSLVGKEINIDRFVRTNMIQMSWTLAALFNSHSNVIVGPWSIAAKGDNTGGYGICRVFGLNLNKVFDHFKDRGVNGSYFRIINRRLLFLFFPTFIRGLRRRAGHHDAEDYYSILYPVFKTYMNFWLFTVPAMMLPLPLIRLLMLFIRETSKTSARITRLLDRFICRRLG